MFLRRYSTAQQKFISQFSKYPNLPHIQAAGLLTETMFELRDEKKLDALKRVFIHKDGVEFLRNNPNVFNQSLVEINAIIEKNLNNDNNTKYIDPDDADEQERNFTRNNF